MADSSTRRAERADFQDGDPFAELTRIMGQDPRRSEEPNWHDAGIDLESELLGGLDLSEEAGWPAAETARREPEAEAAAPEQAGEVIPISFARGLEPQATWEPEAGADDLSLDLDDSFADDIEAALRRNVADFEPAATKEIPAPAAEPVAQGELEPAALESGAGGVDSDQQDAALASDDVSEPAYEEFQPEPAGAELAAEALLEEPAQEPADEDQTIEAMREGSVHETAEEVQANDWFSPADLDAAAADDEINGTAQPEDWPSDEMQAAEEPALATPDVSEPAADTAADAEMDFDLPDLDLADLDWAEPEPAAAADDEHAEVDDVVDVSAVAPHQTPNIEDELAAMLAADPAPAVARAAVAPAVGVSWQPLASGQPLPRAEAASSHASEAYQQGATVPAYAASSYRHPEAEAQTSHGQQLYVEPSEPEADASPRSMEDEYGVPEIETVEVAESVPGPAQELHVPDLPAYDAPPPAEFDDLAAELDQAFEMLDVERDQRPAEPVAAATAYPVEYAGYAAAAAAAPQRRDEDYYASDYPAQQPEQEREEQWSLGDDIQERYAFEDSEEFEFETEPASEIMPPERRQGSRRGLFVALGVVALAVAGGAGVYALSSGGTSVGEPVLVRADVEPVRVRPETPGGTVVPNQDNEVYRRLSGIQQEQAASQERLVTTAEEPVDVAARTAPPPVIAEPEPEIEAVEGLDAMTDEVVPEVAADAGEVPAAILEGERIAVVKADERLGAQQDEAVASAADDMIALQPRRVRTMVVRPDGTMVPREEIEPEAGAAGAETEQQVASLPMALEPATDASAASVPEAVAPQIEPAADAASAEAQPAPAETGAAATAPALPGNVPTPVDRPQTVRQPEAAQQPAAAAPQQQVASIAPTAPATGAMAAAGEWSMQIASQPSAESAQATYQDLARRYGSLLEGRGVNIVRAEIEGRGTYYRVRIPTATRDDAISLCTRYKAAGGSCFVSR